jgi:starch-binding outer membrane protein, SusD/RagB family
MDDNYHSRHANILKTIFSVSLLSSSCAEFVEIEPPRTELVTATVFANDQTANAAIIDIYSGLSSTGFASGTVTSLSLFCSYSADEQQNYSAVTELQEFADNDLLPKNAFILSLWSDMYKTIYKANAIIEGCAQSQGISADLKKQLEGEAKFFRAFSHFYLVNLYGDVPLVTTTNYQTNLHIPRSPVQEVYQQIIADLKDAQILLPEDYAFANNERVRVNKYAATTMLARAYLHVKDWPNAEIEATRIIGHSLLYSLVNDLNLVFRKNSSEAVWQFHTYLLVNDFYTFRILPSSAPITGAFREGFVNNFESSDERRKAWIRKENFLGVNYF